jgi:hypothetical protein
MDVDKDAFSSGQIGSKIWLAEHIESAVSHYQLKNPLRICMIGGWYGLLNFILQTRNGIKILHVRSVDVDNTACQIADVINEYWVSRNWQFKSIVSDANAFDYDNYDCVINTVVEHIDSNLWFEKIPKGSLVVLQSNNMKHEDHIHNHKSLKDFDNSYNFSDTFFLGQKDFMYPNWNFKRYMKIGIK